MATVEPTSRASPKVRSDILDPEVEPKTVALGTGQAARRRLVIAAASSLAESGGYEAVTMKTVADHSGVALATIYRWFSSKDHLLAEALLSWIDEIGAELVMVEIAGDTPADRVATIMNRVSDEVQEHPRLATAAITALLSHDEAVLDIFDQFHAAIGRWIAIAVGDDAQVAQSIELLEHLLWASLIALVRGRDTPDSVRARMVLAAQLLVREP